ncbi:MAG TPA: TQO small subunit DoxD [Chloroflexota bacterium]|nr:TQO small subunit DoxD [Chloroflexota bacterium]
MRWLNQGLRIPLEYFAILRITVGLGFLLYAANSVAQGWLRDGAGLSRYVDGLLRTPFPDPVFRAFLQGVVLPNAGVFAVLVTLANALVGLLLVLGLGTRLAAAAALLLGLGYWLAGGVMSPSNLPRSYLFMEIVVLLAVPGVVWGLDSRLLGRAPAWLVGSPRRFPLAELHAVGPLRGLGVSGFAAPLSYLALLRIGLGFSWLVGATGLIMRDTATNPQFVLGSFENYAKLGGRDPLTAAWFQLVADHYRLFGPLIVAGELAAGILLLLGLGTRAGALIAMWMSWNFHLLKGWGNLESYYFDTWWFVCELLFFLTGAGLALGLDGVLRRYLPRALTGAEATDVVAPPGERVAAPLVGS